MRNTHRSLVEKRKENVWEKWGVEMGGCIGFEAVTFNHMTQFWKLSLSASSLMTETQLLKHCGFVFSLSHGSLIENTSFCCSS